MIADSVSLELKNSLSELSTLGSSLEQFGEALGISSKILFEISLSIEELFSNIVSYGYTDDAVHWIKLTISYEDQMLVIRLEDDGIPFNPLRAEEPDCECPIERKKKKSIDNRDEEDISLVDLSRNYHAENYHSKADPFAGFFNAP